MRLGVVLALVTWLPLVILAAIEGVLFEGAVKVSFVASLAAHVRFLVAIPLLFVALTSGDHGIPRSAMA